MIEPKLTVSDGTVSTCIEIDKKHIEAIANEYWAAKEKHPKFCDRVIDDRTDWEYLEKTMKNVNDNGAPYFGENLLLEEVADAFAAYQKGDKTQALQEFAQCGAVILRIMETIEKEMKK